MSIDNSDLFKYKAALERKTADGVNNTNSLTKNQKKKQKTTTATTKKNSCSIKVFEQLLEIIRNAIH